MGPRAPLDGNLSKLRILLKETIANLPRSPEPCGGTVFLWWYRMINHTCIYLGDDHM